MIFPKTVVFAMRKCRSSLALCYVCYLGDARLGRAQSRGNHRISRLAVSYIMKRLATRMQKAIQVRISKGDRQFVAECLDLPVVTQAATLDELFFNIREAIGLHLEGEDSDSLES